MVSDRFTGAALIFAFLLLTGIVVVVGHLGLGGMERLHADAQNIADTQWQDVQLAIEALDYSNQNSRIVMQVVLTGDRSEIDPLLVRRAENDQRISALIARLQGRVGSEKEQALLDAVNEARRAYLEGSRHTTAIRLQQNDAAQARRSLVGVTPLLARYHVAWSDFIRFQTEEMNQQLQWSAARYASDRTRTIYLLVFAVVLAVGIAAFQIRKTMAEAQGRAKAARSMRQMNEDLERIVLQRTSALDQSNRELTAEVAKRSRVEESLVWKTAFLEAQANSTIDGILVVDGNQRKLFQNQRLVDLFELPRAVAEEDDDNRVLQFVLGKIAEPEQFLRKVKYLYDHPDETSRDEVRLKDGKVLDRYSSPVVGADARQYGRIWIFRDITDRKLAEEQVQFLAYYDALTGLPNRSLLQDRLAKALAGARRRNDKVALLFLDLDRFKIINDSLGHSVGDLLLQEVGERLKGWARDQDTVARVGGDEFLIVLTGLKDPGGAAIAAERIVSAMRGGVMVQGHALNVNCSIGISIFPEHGEDAETLIKNADAAMYSAKDSGRNNFRFFTEDMNAQVVERLTLENSLRLALEKGEFSLVYQPQIDIDNGNITGVEALLRWRHPVLGLVSPDKFIGVAENSGLIIPIGEWVLRTACSQARAWQDQGLLPVPMAVNVSALQFGQEGFREVVRRVLHETGLEPQYLELELTESLLLTNEDVTFSVLQDLKDMGLKLAIDDFGTGYSSLSYLKKFPVNKLKIDRSFIRDVGVSADDEAITIAIISMAKSLHLKVIAEGVETEAQMSFLRSHHCDEIQGYYFSRPLPAEELVDKLAQHVLLACSERSQRSLS
jgi:diguanylate cyclase (GGDEF)-like protein